MTSDGTEDDVCVGYPEHRGVRETYRGDDGIQWECTRCGAEGWEDAVTSDGTDDDEVDQGCCTDRCTGACGGYGFAFELAARNAPSPSDGTDFFEEDEPLEDVVTAFEQGERRVTFIGRPVDGSSVE